jgi:hypothetical protein
VFERKIIRKINNEWKLRTNEGIDNILANPDIVRFIKSQRLRWRDHLEIMDKNKLAKKVMYKRLSSAKRRGRPKQRWIDDVTKDLKKMNIIGWKEKAKKRVT